MNRINCSYKDCQTFIETPEPVTPVARYTCRQHVGKNSAADLHFQDSQFDPRIGDGADPRAYERGTFGSRKSGERDNTDVPRHGTNAPRKFVDKIIRKAGPELTNHDNKDEIIEILKEDVRDQNVGVTKSGREDE